MTRQGPPQTSRKAESGAGYDMCWTPWHGVAPLFPYIAPGTRVWEPCAGAGWLARWLREYGCDVIETDYTTGVDFLAPWKAIDPARYDIIVTNVPFTLKYQMLRRAYEIGKPFALLVPAYTVHSASAADLADTFGMWEELRLKQRVNFHMPDTGFCNNGAQFTTWWLCRNVLPRPVIYADLPKPRQEHRLIKPPKKIAATTTVQATFELLEAA